MAAAVEVGCDNCVGGTEDDGGISGGMLSVDNGGCNCCVGKDATRHVFFCLAFVTN